MFAALSFSYLIDLQASISTTLYRKFTFLRPYLLHTLCNLVVVTPLTFFIDVHKYLPTMVSPGWLASPRLYPCYALALQSNCPPSPVACGYWQLTHKCSTWSHFCIEDFLQDLRITTVLHDLHVTLLLRWFPIMPLAIVEQATDATSPNSLRPQKAPQRTVISIVYTSTSG